MKILHCIWSFHTGGTEEMLLDIITAQSKKHDVHLVIINDDFSQDMVDKIPENVVVHCMGRKRGSKSLLPLLRLNMLVLRLLPDAIHMHNPELPAVVLPWTGSRKFLTVHALDRQLQGWRHVRRVVAISQAVADDLRQRYGIDALVVTNGIDAARILRRAPEAFSGTFGVVQVGRLDIANKGQDILIKALADVRRRGYGDVRLTLIGAGSDAGVLAEMAEAEGVADIVTFAGLRDKHQIYATLRDYDLMVHPSRREGFGLTIAEAMTAGLPVAVPDEGGPYEVTDKGRLALTFPTDDVKACADAIIRAHDHYDELLARVDEARDYAVRNFSIDRTVSEYLSMYFSKSV